MATIQETIDELWEYGFREAEIASDLGISQREVIFCRRGKVLSDPQQKFGTETRYATMFGRGGSTACRVVAVTLPWSGTLN